MINSSIAKKKQQHNEMNKYLINDIIFSANQGMKKWPYGSKTIEIIPYLDNGE